MDETGGRQESHGRAGGTHQEAWLAVAFAIEECNSTLEVFLERTLETLSSQDIARARLYVEHARIQLIAVNSLYQKLGEENDSDSLSDVILIFQNLAEFTMAFIVILKNSSAAELKKEFFVVLQAVTKLAMANNLYIANRNQKNSKRPSATILQFSKISKKNG